MFFTTPSCIVYSCFTKQLSHKKTNEDELQTDFSVKTPKAENKKEPQKNLGLFVKNKDTIS
jgi:hypothetical protein